MAKQAVKKGAGIVRKGSVLSFKEKKGMTYKPGESKVTVSSANADKPMDWLIMPKAYQDATKLPGIPIGYSTMVMGHSNTGKSTLINHAIVAAVRQKILPVIIDTENNFSFEYAVSMGLEATPIWDDVEVEKTDIDTGEVTVIKKHMIVSWEGNFLYYNSSLLADQYGNYDYANGKETSTKRDRAVIEDVGACIDDILKAQSTGELDVPILFIWDSVGSVKSFKEYSAKGAGNNMWAANAISTTFEELIGAIIPGSRKVSSKHTNTFLYVNKIWMDNMTNPTGPAIMKPKGGESLLFKARLQLIMGGKTSAGVKHLTATAKGEKYKFATETKIRVEKNHLNAPYNVTYEGPIVASDMGFISENELDSFKKEHVSRILNELQSKLNDYEITEADISYEEDIED